MPGSRPHDVHRDGGYGMHTTAEATHFFLKFNWFPPSELQRQIDNIKNQT
jgi:hypothetical protein